jgi:hypothetical protein
MQGFSKKMLLEGVAKLSRDRILKWEEGATRAYKKKTGRNPDGNSRPIVN